MVLPKAIEKFRFHCVYEKNLSLKTMHAYDADLNQFLEKFKNYKINEISKFVKFFLRLKYFPCIDF